MKKGGNMTEVATQAGITIEEQIEQALKRMPYTETVIAGLKTEYMGLRTNGIEDTAAYEAVHAALMTMVKVRTGIELTRKQLKADALKFGKAVDAEATRLAGLAAPVETYLYEQRDIVDKEKERIRTEKEEQEQTRLQGRVAKLLGFGMTFDGNIYRRSEMVIAAINLKRLSDEDFETVLKRVEEDYQAEQAEIAEEARLKKEDEDRIAAEKAEAERLEGIRKIEDDRLRKEEDDRLSAERERLKKIADEQAIEKALIKAKQEEVEAIQKAIEDKQRKDEEDKRRQEELEKARIEAAEQAKKDERARIERETKEKKEQEEREAIEAEEKKAQMTDKEKLKELLTAIELIDIPQFKSKKAKVVADQVQGRLIASMDIIREAL